MDTADRAFAAPTRVPPAPATGTSPAALVVSAAATSQPATVRFAAPVALPAVPEYVPSYFPGHVPAPPEPVPPHHAGPRVRLGAVVCWQLAVALVLASLGRPWPVTTAVVTAAVLLAAATVTVRGRQPAELAVRGLDYLNRVRRADLPPQERTSALLAHLLPGATLRTVDIGDLPVLAISHRHGLTALIEPHTTTHPPPPSELLPSPEDDRYLFGVQSVFHAGARPGSPPRRWFSVTAIRTVGTADDEELALSLRNASRRVVRTLKHAGIVAEPLPGDVALAAVAALAHVTGGRTQLREDWDFWRTGTISQTCLRLRGWDRLTAAHIARLQDNLLARPANVSVTLTAGTRQTNGGAETDAVLRLAAETEAAITAAVGGLAALCATYGIRLERFDGRQQAGVAATLPIGGFPQ